MDGFQLRRRRIGLGIKQFQLAGMLGCSQTELCAMEKGRRDITPETPARIADALELVRQGYIEEGAR